MRPARIEMESSFADHVHVHQEVHPVGAVGEHVGSPGADSAARLPVARADAQAHREGQRQEGGAAEAERADQRPGVERALRVEAPSVVREEREQRRARQRADDGAVDGCEHVPARMADRLGRA